MKTTEIIQTADNDGQRLPGIDRDRLASVVGAIASRAANWPWYPVYRRWRQGERVSAFHRKWAAVSLRRLQLHIQGQPFNASDAVTIKPLPKRETI